MIIKEKLIDEELKIKRFYSEFGHIEVMEQAQFSPAENSVSEFYIEDEHRGKGYGDVLLKEAMARYEDLGAQVSSMASLKIFYNNGYRPLKEEDITFEEVVEKFNENGRSLFMEDKRKYQNKLENKIENKRRRPKI